MRLDKALSTHTHIRSRTFATHLIHSGCVMGIKSKIKPSMLTTLNEVYVITILPVETYNLTPYELALNIVYEDQDLIVVNKPSGLVVHPSAGHWQKTLVHALLHHSKKWSSGSDVSRPGIVHRIDKDTSGLLVVAKNDRTHIKLSEQFKNKTTHRIYSAVCYGIFKNSSGQIKSQIARHPKDRKKFASIREKSNSLKKSKLAVTHYNVIAQHLSGLSQVTCRLETGRTHQIRVHLSELGHPIVADPIYCSNSRFAIIRPSGIKEEIKMAPHLMLHAAELGFLHPRTKKKMIFKAPWPPETHKLLKALNFL